MHPLRWLLRSFSNRREDFLFFMNPNVRRILSADQSLAERHVADQLPVGHAVARIFQVSWQRYPFRFFDLVSVLDTDKLRQGSHSANKMNVRFAKLVRVFGGKGHD